MDVVNPVALRWRREAEGHYVAEDARRWYRIDTTRPTSWVLSAAVKVGDRITEWRCFGEFRTLTRAKTFVAQISPEGGPEGGVGYTWAHGCKPNSLYRGDDAPNETNGWTLPAPAPFPPVFPSEPVLIYGNLDGYEGHIALLAGHGHDPALIDLVGKWVLGGEHFGVFEVFWSKNRVKWCERLDGWGCDEQGEWHRHWTEIKPTEDTRHQWTAIYPKDIA